MVAPAPPGRTAGQTSIAPLTNATPTRNILSVTNFRMLTSAMSRSRRTAAQHFAHGSDKMQRTLVAHGIIHVIGAFSRAEDAFFTEDRQMLRDVALRSPFFSSKRRHTRSLCDWSSDVCSSD